MAVTKYDHRPEARPETAKVKGVSQGREISSLCWAVQNLPTVSNALSLPDISRSPPPSPTASIRTSSGERRVQAHVADNGI